MCLLTGAVEWYEVLFCNIEDRRENRSYILRHAVGYPPGGQLKPNDIGMLWKQLGYSGGALVLDALIYGSTAVSRPTQPADVRGFLHSDVLATLQSKALLAVRMLRPDDPKSAAMILRLYSWLTELEKRHARKMGEYRDITVNMQACLQQIDTSNSSYLEAISVMARRTAGQAGPEPPASTPAL